MKFGLPTYFAFHLFLKGTLYARLWPRKYLEVFDLLGAACIRLFLFTRHFLSSQNSHGGTRFEIHNLNVDYLD